MIYECANAYYFRHLNKIGGIESHLRYLAKKYADKYEITVFYKTADADQLELLKRYVRVVQLQKNDLVKCKKLFCCFNREILDQCQAEKKYLVLHGDYKDMVKRGQLTENSLPIDKRIDEYLGVSQLVCDSWKELTGIKARNVSEPVILDKCDKPLMFVSATRLTPEKGWHRMVELADKLNEHNVNYTWFIYTNSNKPPVKNMVILPPRYDITEKLGGYDAYIQLSDNEGFCLSIVEALIRGVPVIATDLPVLRELKLNDSNSVILPFDMSNIPIERIRRINELNFVYKPPKDRWDVVLDHTSPEKDKLIEVMALNGYRNRNIVDAELGRVPDFGERWFITKSRYEELMAFCEKNRVQLIKRV